MLHEDTMCLVPVAVTEHQSLFKAPEQAGGTLGLVCYTCFVASLLSQVECGCYSDVYESDAKFGISKWFEILKMNTRNQC